MNNAELYQKSNSMQRRDAVECLEEYGKKIKWKNFDRIIDIGCGDGGVTTSILMKYIPNNFKILMGCDISEKMVQFANKTHAKDRVKFSVLNIEGEMPPDLEESFDHAFSFYVLHWIKNQERAFTNIFQMLVEGGDCLHVFLSYSPVYDIFRKLSLDHKWRQYLTDMDSFMTPYQHVQEPEKEVRRLMEKIGFKNIMVECKSKSFVFDEEESCKKAMAATNPFEIPVDVQKDFYFQFIRELRMVDKVYNVEKHDANINIDYNIVVAYGSK